MKPPMKRTPSCKDLPKFFKVYIPDICFETLKIPNAFISRIKRALPKRVVLRSSGGKLNIVGVKQTVGDVFFFKNWQQFVQKYSVKAGDFLVFQYNGECIFDFVILDQSGYMKGEQEEENDDEEVEVEEMDISREEGPWEGEEKEEEEMNDCDSDDDEEDVSVEDEDDDEDDEEDEDDEDDEDEDEEQANPLRKKRSMERNGDTNRFHPDISEITIKAEETDEPETDKLELNRSIHIKNPHFLTKPRSWMKERLNVPVKWLARQNLALEGTITFLGPLGKESPGTVVFWSDGRIWIEGWGDFCGENNLKEHENCMCEFTPERGRWGKIVRVHLTKNM